MNPRPPSDIGSDLADLGLSLARAVFAPDQPLDPPDCPPERDYGELVDQAYEAHVAAELDRSTP